MLSYAIFLGLDIDCGCFGLEDSEAQAFAGIRVALMRDLLFVVFAVIPLVLRKLRLTKAPSSKERVLL